MLILFAFALAASPPPAAYRPRIERQRGDLPPCPGIAPDIRRPRGSNGYSIALRSYGTDIAVRFVGRPATLAVRHRVSLAVGHARIRWIRPREPVTQDLRNDRLDIRLDACGGIASVDCH